MKYIFTITALVVCLWETSAVAQIKGKVVDETNQPIPYVNIWVENENISTTSDVDGQFVVPIKEEKMLLFSSLGFEKKRLKSTEVSLVQMMPTTYFLNDVVLQNKRDTRLKTIGEVKNSIYQAFENGPKFDAKFFPYNPEYKRTKYLKKVGIFTESAIEEATVKIHFYKPTADGLPGDELLQKDYIVSVKKGSRKSWFDISNLNIVFPKEGLFIAIERLFIAKNRTEKIVPATNANTTKTQVTYYPLPFYSFVSKEYTYTFLGGKWTKEGKKDAQGKPMVSKVFEPTIALVLTN